jgi:hypothetical protein
MTPDGRRKTWGTRLSEDESARADSARGELDRSAWIRGFILGAIGPPREVPAELGIVDARPADPVQAVQAVMRQLPERRPAARDCPHPKTRVMKGLCQACGTYVGR